jgi:hypothetical protein
LGEVLVATASGLFIRHPGIHRLLFSAANRAAKALHDIQDTMNSPAAKRCLMNNSPAVHIGDEEVLPRSAQLGWSRINRMIDAHATA